MEPRRQLLAQAGSHVPGQLGAREEAACRTIGNKSKATCGQSPKLKGRCSNGRCGFVIKLLFIWTKGFFFVCVKISDKLIWPRFMLQNRLVINNPIFFSEKVYEI